MIKKVKTYKHELFGEVRTVKGDNGILFIGNDIATCLKFGRVQQATKDFCKNIIKVQINCITAIKDNKEVYDQRTMNAIYVDDVINMINRSSMIDKRLFEMWIKEDILGEKIFNRELYKDEYIYMLKKENELLTSKIYLLEEKLLKDIILNNVGLTEQFILDFNNLTDENKNFLTDVLGYLKTKQSIKE